MTQKYRVTSLACSVFVLCIDNISSVLFTCIANMNKTTIYIYIYFFFGIRFIFSVYLLIKYFMLIIIVCTDSYNEYFTVMIQSHKRGILIRTVLFMCEQN